TVRDAVEDSFTGPFLRDAVRREIIPSMDSPENELVQYMDTVLDRFRNPYIHHELKSIALNSVSKFRVRLLPSLLAYQERLKAIPPRLAFSLACLILFYRGEWQGCELPVNDEARVVDISREAWAQGARAARRALVLAQEPLSGVDLSAMDGLQPMLTPFPHQLQALSLPDAFAAATRNVHFQNP